MRRSFSAAALDGWKMSLFADVAKEPAAASSAFPNGPNFPSAPVAVQSDDGSNTTYVLDGQIRRPIDRDGLQAWHLAPVTRKADELAALTEGPAWPKTPFAFTSDGAQVYVLDVKVPDDLAAKMGGDAPAPGEEDGQPGSGSAANLRSAPADTGGCAQTGAGSHETNGVALFAVAAAVGMISRRRRARA
jgi:hypothetical protein